MCRLCIPVSGGIALAYLMNFFAFELVFLHDVLDLVIVYF